MKRISNHRVMRPTDLGLAEDPAIAEARLQGYREACDDIARTVRVRQNRHEDYRRTSGRKPEGPDPHGRWNECDLILGTITHLKAKP